MDTQRQRTDGVTAALAAACSLIDPGVIHTVAFIVSKVCLDMSNSGSQTHVERTSPSMVPEWQESKIDVSAEPSGRPFTNKL